MRFFLFRCLFFVSCFGPIGPEQRIRTFYKDLESAPSLSSLEEHFSSAESLGEFEVPIKPYEVKKLKFVSLNEKASDKVFLTVDLELSKGRDQIEVRKIFELSKISEDWKIDKIENVKTYIEIEKSIEIKKPL